MRLARPSSALARFIGSRSVLAARLRLGSALTASRFNSVPTINAAAEPRRFMATAPATKPASLFLNFY